MKVDLADVVEEVRQKHFSDTVDADLAKDVLMIEARHVEDRTRAKDEVARTIHRHAAEEVA